MPARRIVANTSGSAIVFTVAFASGVCTSVGS